MEMDAKGNDERQINVEADGGARADGVPHEIVTKANERAHRGQHGSDKALALAQCMLEEKIAEYLTDVKAYEARISHLKSMLAEFGIRPDGSSSNTPFLEIEDIDHVPLMVYTSVQAERDAAVEQATTANLHALKVSIANQELQRELEVLRQNSFEAENQALR